MIDSDKIIFDYFPQLSVEQIAQFSRLPELYSSWNEKINVVSRKDIENLIVNHVLHSLGIAKVIAFKNKTSVLDIGTGGGFPGIPLAILFPEVSFHLVDSIGKKITVVNEVILELGLKNVVATKSRAEEIKEKFDFVVSRAVAKLPELYQWSKPLIKKDGFNVLHNGILCLKGGDLTEEIESLKKPVLLFDLQDYFKGNYFETKKVVYIAI